MKHSLIFLLVAAYVLLCLCPLHASAAEYDPLRGLREIKTEEELLASEEFKNAVRVTELTDMDSSGVMRESGRYRYLVPLTAVNDYTYAILIVVDGEIISHGAEMEYDSPLELASYLFEPDLVGNIMSEFGGEISDVSAMTVMPILADFVYFRSDGKAFVIPFVARPDFLELDNGVVYEYEVFAGKVTVQLKEMSDSWWRVTFIHGLTEFAIVAAWVAGAVLIISIAIIVIKKKSKNDL